MHGLTELIDSMESLQNIFKNHMETQETLAEESNNEEKEQCWKCHNI